METLDEITQACRKMSETKTGALIVLAHTSSIDQIVETGDVVDANINRRLIENIFFKNAPLHDGAMVIANNRIVAARCTLPISENPNIPAQYGMRHRAATGLTEQTDATVIVVSEETITAEKLGAGEILLTSMDGDGTKAGYDIELTKAISEAVNIPVIASGGAGTEEHFYEALTEGGAEAALAASLFHYKELEIKQVKQYLKDKGVSVRL